MTCSHPFRQLLHDETGEVCIDCGAVTLCQTLSYTPAFSTETALSIDKPHPLLKRIKAFANKFHASALIVEETLALTRSRQGFRNADALILAALYISMRNHRMPITIHQMCQGCDNPRLVLLYFKRLIKHDSVLHVDVDAFIPMLIQKFIKHEKQTYEVKARKLTSLSKYFWLDQGRSPSLVAGACIYFVIADANYGEKPSGKVVKKIADFLSVSIEQLRVRIKELKGYLVCVASRIPYIMETFQDEDVWMHLDDILLSQDLIEQPDAPAFTASEYRREILVRKIRGAQERISLKAMLMYEEQMGLDELDKEIEALLERSVGEDEILNTQFDFRKAMVVDDEDFNL